MLILGAVLQGCAVAYGLVLAKQRRDAASAWVLLLLGAMTSMLVWRVVVLLRIEPPAFFNPLIALWGSTCMLGAMFLFGREVARRERAEAERDALLQSERAARRDAERAMRLKDDFLATLSHELRTPLAAVLGWCTVARGALEQGQDVTRALDTIERNAKIQVRLVDDLLDVTRMQAGNLHLELTTLSLELPVRAAFQSVRPTADAKAIALELTCDGPPPFVLGDAGRLQQVITNLLTNALKFTPRGGAVSVRLGVADGRARLVVTDNGEGMEEAFLPHLFERFRQADSTVRRHHGGLGLGLSIVANLVRLHGGEVQAESEGRGKGSRFTLTLPLARPQDVRVDTAPAEEVKAVADSLAGIRIVLIDDEQDVRTAVSRMLERLGAVIVMLDSGAALQATLASFRPQLLVVDIGMPGEDGYTLIRRIRKLPKEAGGQTPAISLTAHAREEDRAHALACGFQDHLPKPVDLTQLAAAVRKFAAADAVAPQGQRAQAARA